VLTSLHDGVAEVDVDPTQIEQVIMNLVVNARDAMPSGGTLRIETTSVDLDEDAAAGLADIRPGRHEVLTVADDGEGMDAATQSRIFEPFFTTKERGRGTGLGLATVFGIVKQSGGSIFVTSTPGRGTTFDVYLRRAERALETTSHRPPTNAPRRGDEAILLVEGDDALRGGIRVVLERRGYRVFEARGAEDALALAAAHPSAIDLVLTDAVGGEDVAVRVRQRHPAIKVMVMSSHASGALLASEREELAFLRMPVTPETLVKRVREVLGHEG
jgi:CheY-like chemotaxis protein